MGLAVGEQRGSDRGQEDHIPFDVDKACVYVYIYTHRIIYIYIDMYIYICICR